MRGQILTYIYILIGLLMVFVGVFVFMSLKIKRDDLSKEVEGIKQFSQQHKRLKENLSETQKKNEILEHYLSLSEDARKEILEQLEEKTGKS